MKDLFGNDTDPNLRSKNKDGSFKFNPMVQAYGQKEGFKCKTCKHLFRKSYAGVYYKCKFRGDANGAGTDHRVNWPACNKYEE